LSTSDKPLFLVALATVTMGGKSLAKFGHLPVGYAELCDSLFSKAKQIQPAITTSCDPQVPLPEENPPPARIRVGGNVQAANLIKKVRPAYPPEAKSRHIQGTVRFSVIIDTEGKISNMTLESAPLALYESARDAVRQWVYKPTLLNGRPIEVVTRIDVNYALQ
jgi:TonB family protein